MANEKSYELHTKEELEAQLSALENEPSLTDGLGVRANVSHAIRMTGKKAAAFSSRIKEAISTKYHAFVNSAREKAQAAKEAVKGTATNISNTIHDKTVHISNSLDGKAYHIAQEDYQKLMKNKTSKLDEKISVINDRIKAIKTAEVGTEKGNLASENDKKYLLHRAEELLKKYTKEKTDIEREQAELESYKDLNANAEKGQATKIKISGKRRILIGALDLKRIATNAAKAVGKGVKNAGLGIAAGVVAISDRVKSANATMMEKIAERKVQKEAERLAKEEAKKAQEYENMTLEEKFISLDEDGIKAVERKAELQSELTKMTIEFFCNYDGIKAVMDEIDKEHPEAGKISTEIYNGNISDAERKINEAAASFSVAANEELTKDPETAIKVLTDVERENEVKAEKTKAEKDAAYDEGYAKGKEETEKSLRSEIEAMKKEMEELRAQVKATATKKETKVETVDYSKLKKADLQELVNEKGLKPASTKAEMISQLEGLKEQITSTKKK